MKYHFKSKSFCKSSLGFTLVETVVAMGIITIMMTAFLAAFGPAVKGVKKSISVKEANRLASTLEYEMSVLKESDTDTYNTAFEKAFDLIKGNEGLILLYQYKGDLSKPAEKDGSLSPYTSKDGVAGKDYVLESVVRKFKNPKVEKELKPGIVEGRVFVIRMIQLVFVNDVLKVAGKDGAPGGVGKIVDPYPPNESATDSKSYPQAVIPFQAKFYTLKSNQYAYVKSLNLNDLNADGNPKVLGKPVFTRNMAVRR